MYNAANVHFAIGDESGDTGMNLFLRIINNYSEKCWFNWNKSRVDSNSQPYRPTFYKLDADELVNLDPEADNLAILLNSLKSIARVNTGASSLFPDLTAMYNPMMDYTITELPESDTQKNWEIESQGFKQVVKTGKTSYNLSSSYGLPGYTMSHSYKNMLLGIDPSAYMTMALGMYQDCDDEFVYHPDYMVDEGLPIMGDSFPDYFEGIRSYGFDSEMNRSTKLFGGRFTMSAFTDTLPYTILSELADGIARVNIEKEDTLKLLFVLNNYFQGEALKECKTLLNLKLVSELISMYNNYQSLTTFENNM